MDMTNHTNLKFAIFGVGGTGGVIGGYLASVGNDVTFLARAGKRPDGPHEPPRRHHHPEGQGAQCRRLR